MNHLIAHSVMVCLSLIVPGCRKAPIENYHAKTLSIDARYSRDIRFDPIGITIPIREPDAYVRIDEPVSDMNQHRQEILKELGILSANIAYTNPAESSAGQHMHLTFADGRKCSFLWVAKSPDERIAKAVEEHEKYHALYHLSPSGLADLSNAIRQRGFNINLEDYDEELSATIVQVLSLHLQGVPFEQMYGSEMGIQAKQILIKNVSNQLLHRTQ